MIAIRASEARDERFVIASWLSSSRKSNDAGLIQEEDWFPTMWPQREKVLRKPGVRCLVAADTEESSADLFGFIVADTDLDVPLVYYCYVKQPYRRSGLARRLFAAVGIDPARRFEFVCKTPIVARLADKIPYARYNPSVGRRPKTERNRAA